MALNSVVKVVTLWLLGFTHLASGRNNDTKGCITENLIEVVKAIHIPNNNHLQSWVKPDTTGASLAVAFRTPDGTYNTICEVHFNTSDAWHNFTVTRSVDDKNSPTITVLVPELGINYSKNFTAIFHTLYLRSHNNNVQWTNCSTDKTTASASESTSTTSSTSSVSTSVSTSTTTTPPTLTNTNKVLAAGVVFLLIAVVAGVYGLITRYRHQHLLLQKDPITTPETTNNEYEEWNEKWKIQPVTPGNNKEHSSDISPLTVTTHRPGSAHDSENSLYGVI